MLMLAAHRGLQDTRVPIRLMSALLSAGGTLKFPRATGRILLILLTVSSASGDNENPLREDSLMIQLDLKTQLDDFNITHCVCDNGFRFGKVDGMDNEEKWILFKKQWQEDLQIANEFATKSTIIPMQMTFKLDNVREDPDQWENLILYSGLGHQIRERSLDIEQGWLEVGYLELSINPKKESMDHTLEIVSKCRTHRIPLLTGDISESGTCLEETEEVQGICPYEISIYKYDDSCPRGYRTLWSTLETIKQCAQSEEVEAPSSVAPADAGGSQDTAMTASAEETCHEQDSSCNSDQNVSRMPSEILVRLDVVRQKIPGAKLHQGGREDTYYLKNKRAGNILFEKWMNVSGLVSYSNRGDKKHLYFKSSIEHTLVRSPDEILDEIKYTSETGKSKVVLSINSKGILDLSLEPPSDPIHDEDRNLRITMLRGKIDVDNPRNYELSAPTANTDLYEATISCVIGGMEYSFKQGVAECIHPNDDPTSPSDAVDIKFCPSGFDKFSKSDQVPAAPISFGEVPRPQAEPSEPSQTENPPVKKETPEEASARVAKELQAKYLGLDANVDDSTLAKRLQEAQENKYYHSIGASSDLSVGANQGHDFDEESDYQLALALQNAELSEASRSAREWFEKEKRKNNYRYKKPRDLDFAQYHVNVPLPPIHSGETRSQLHNGNRRHRGEGRPSHPRRLRSSRG